MIIKKESKGQIYDIIIDDEDYEKVSKHTWSIKHDKCYNKYCQTNIYIDGKQKTLRLHRLLMNLKKGDNRVINNIDGNGLNNMKSNLEICDNMYNCQSINTKKRFGNVYTMKIGIKKYRAEVKINKKKYQKYFFTREEAQTYLDELEKIAIAETKLLNN